METKWTQMESTPILYADLRYTRCILDGARILGPPSIHPPSVH